MYFLFCNVRIVMYEVNASDINVQHALREGNGDLQQYLLGKADEDDYTGTDA